MTKYFAPVDVAAEGRRIRWLSIVFLVAIVLTETSISILKVLSFLVLVPVAPMFFVTGLTVLADRLKDQFRGPAVFILTLMLPWGIQLFLLEGNFPAHPVDGLFSHQFNLVSVLAFAFMGAVAYGMSSQMSEDFPQRAFAMAAFAVLYMSGFRSDEEAVQILNPQSSFNVYIIGVYSAYVGLWLGMKRNERQRLRDTP